MLLAGAGSLAWIVRGVRRGAAALDPSKSFARDWIVAKRIKMLRASFIAMELGLKHGKITPLSENKSLPAGRLGSVPRITVITNIARAYIMTALFWLLIGMALGLWSGATHALQYRPLHITIMMLGFVLLTVYGVIYRLWPQVEAAQFATLQFGLSTLGSLLMVFGTIQQMINESILLDGAGAVLAFCGAILMMWLFKTMPDTERDGALPSRQSGSAQQVTGTQLFAMDQRDTTA